MNRIISISLWGKEPKYTVGAIRNAELAKIHYSDFKFRVYVDESVSEVDKQSLLAAEAQVFQVRANTHSGGWAGLFWRYFPSLDPSTEILLPRDADSRLSVREVSAVRSWLESGCILHVMRDHPGQYMPIMGGMCGMRGDGLRLLGVHLNNFLQQPRALGYNSDQMFLESVFADTPMEKICLHDEIFDDKKFPTSRIGSEYVGEIFDENERNIDEHKRIMNAWRNFKAICPTALLVRRP